MLLRVTQTVGRTVVAIGGEVGKVHDIYFDDAHWVVRYLIVATGGWLFGRKVLISPQAVERLSRERRDLSLSLTRDRVQHSPNIDTDKPVSRQHETEFNHYYGYSTYWAGTTQWGNGPLPPASIPPAADMIELQERRLADTLADEDSHLRSTNAVTGYSIDATDDAIGRVVDLIFDAETWAIHYLVVNTAPWLFGRRVLLPREAVDSIDWASESVKVRQSRAEIERGVQFDEESLASGVIAETSTVPSQNDCSPTSTVAESDSSARRIP